MHKTQRRVMLKFLKQHGGKWSSTDGKNCDICQCIGSEQQWETGGLASYISKQPGTIGPYSDVQPVLCTEHARELGLIW